jgi:hypothetical protein
VIASDDESLNSRFSSMYVGNPDIEDENGLLLD